MALCRAAGVMTQPEHGVQLWSDATALRAPALAERLCLAGSVGPRLLLEVSVLLFAMGCELGRARSAHSLASALAAAAAALSSSGPVAGGDDALWALAHTAKALTTVPLAAVRFEVGPAASQYPAACRHRAVLRCSIAAHEVQLSGDLAKVAATVAPPSRWRWRLAGYRRFEELWVLRRGRNSRLYLPAPMPLTWCLEGVALSEALPNLRDRVR